MSYFDRMSCCEQGTNWETTCDLVEKDYENSLWFAAHEGNLDQVQELLSQPGVEVDKKAKFAYTALHFAACHGHLEVFKLLVEHGADINAQTRLFWQTPLHIACEKGQKYIVEYLISKKAEAFISMTDGEKPIHVAAQHQHKEIFDMLVKAYPDLKNRMNNRGKFAEEYLDK